MRRPIRFTAMSLTASLLMLDLAHAEPRPLGEGAPTPDTPDVPALHSSSSPSGAIAPPGFVEMFVAAVLPTDGGPAVVLQDREETTMLPIWIGTSEAHSIQLRLERRRFPRPLTHDLMDTMLSNLGGEVLKIHVDELTEDTFVGTIYVRKGDTVSSFDARPSDSIALAVGNRVPIFVSRALIHRTLSRRQEAERTPAHGGNGGVNGNGGSGNPEQVEQPARARIQTM